MKKNFIKMFVVATWLTFFIPLANGQENLLAWWRLDGGAIDATGNGFNGVPIGAPLFDDMDMKEGKYSLVLDGSTQRVDLDYDEFKAEFTQRTFALWFKTNDPSADQILFEEGGTGKGMAIRVIDNTIEAQANQDGGALKLTTSTVFNSTDWTHVALVFDEGAMTLYVNGFEADMQDTSAMTAVGDHGDPSTIGGSNWSDVFGGSGYLNGKIDDVRVYTAALTTEEVLSVYADPKRLDVKKIPAGTEIILDGKPTDFWSKLSGFDEDQSNTIYNLKAGNDNLVAPTSAADLSSKWNLAYNDTALFGFISVKDDTVQLVGDTVGWFNDAVEIYAKVGNANNANLAGDIGDDCDSGYYQYSFGVEYDPTKVFGLNATCEGIQDGNATWRTDVTSDGYNIEFYILFDGLKDETGSAFVPADGSTMRLEPHIHDNDNENVKEANPRTRSYWSLDGQPGSIEGGHAWEADAWKTGNIGIIEFKDEELAPPQPKSFTIKKIPAGTEIILDGKPTDFWTYLDGFNEDQHNTIYNLKYGNDALVAPTSVADLSSGWNLAYNDTALFGFISVKDDTVQLVGDSIAWFNDAIEIYAKVGNANDANLAGDIGDDCDSGYYQYSFGVEYDPTTVFGLNATCEGIQDGNATWRTDITSDGYNLEFYILFDGLQDETGTAFVPTDGATMRFEPHIHDNDNGDVKEVNPRTRSYWSLDGQPGNIQGGHAWEAAAWQTGTIGTIVFDATELTEPQPKSLTVKKIPAEAEIILDGKNNDFWTSTTGFDTDQHNTIYNLKYENNALVAPESEEDLYSTWNLAYNDTALFGFISVTDDIVQMLGDSVGWFNDLVEVYAKVGDYDNTLLEGDIGDDCSNGYYQYGFAPEHDPTKVYGLNATCQDIQNGNANWRAVRTTDGYDIEFYINWEGLKDDTGAAFLPSDGATMKFEPHIHDNDNTDYGEVNPRTRSYWSLDGQSGSIQGGHAWEAGSWQTGNIGTLVFSANELELEEFSFIDGIIESTWDAHDWVQIDKEIDVDGVDGPRDFSGKAKMRWDADAIYVLFDIEDDIYDISSSTVFLNDIAEIFVDVDNDKPQKFDEGSYFFRYTIGESLSGWQGITEGGQTPPPDVPIGVTINEGTGYIVEFALPFDKIGVSDAQEGKLMGWELVLNDRDGESQRDMLGWMVDEDIAWRDPFRWGTIELLADGAIAGYNQIPEKPVLTATVNGSTVNASWDAVTGVITYQLRQDGTVVVETDQTSAVVNDLPVGVYDFTLIAVGNGEILSPISDAVTLEIEQGQVVLSKPVLTATVNGADVSLSWDAVANATGYQVLQDGTVIETTTATSTEVTGLENGSYSFTVIATADEGNVTSPQSDAVSASITVGIDDVTKDLITLYPNPVSTELSIKNVQVQAISIYALDGTVVLAKQSIKNSDKIYTLDVSGLVRGLYIIEINDGKRDYYSRFMKK